MSQSPISHGYKFSFIEHLDRHIKIIEKIKILREIKKMTPEYMADELGMSVSGYCKIERGNVKLSTEKLEKTSSILEVAANELISSDGLSINFNNNSNSHTFGYNVYSFPEDLKKLYEDKITLLEEKNKFLEEKLKFWEEKSS